MEDRPFPTLLAAVLFAALVALVVAIFVMDYLGASQTAATIADVNSRIAAFDVRLKQIAATGPDKSGKGARMWIAAQTSGVAAAAIQKIAGRIIAAAGASVREVQVLEPDANATPPAAGEPTPVSASFLFETTHAGLSQILTGVEAAQPLLQTDKITIEALPKPEGRGDETETPLRVEVQITGYWLQVKA